MKTANYTMNFSQALAALKEGREITRDAWEEQNCYLHRFGGSTIRCAFTSGGFVSPWTPDSDDLFAEDWREVEE